MASGKAIVLGASGFLGNALVNALLQEGWHVYGVRHRKNLTSGDRVSQIPGGISALSRNLIDEIRPDFVFHCARPVMKGWRRTGRYIAGVRAAVLNGRLLLELSASRTRPPLVFAGGSLAYGNSVTPHKEEAPLKPLSYARQYYRGEVPLHEAIKKASYPAIIIRLPWLLGQGSWFQWFYLNNILKYNAVPRFGQGGNLMSLLDVRDAAALMFSYALNSRAHNIYNIYSPDVITQNEFLAMISGCWQCDIKPWETFYGGRMEKEALEAFTSQIVMQSSFTGILDNHPFIPVQQTLKDIRDHHFF